MLRWLPVSPVLRLQHIGPPALATAPQKWCGFPRAIPRKCRKVGTNCCDFLRRSQAACNHSCTRLPPRRWWPTRSARRGTLLPMMRPRARNPLGSKGTPVRTSEGKSLDGADRQRYAVGRLSRSHPRDSGGGARLIRNPTGRALTPEQQGRTQERPDPVG